MLGDVYKRHETDLPNGGTIIEWVSPPIAPTHKVKGLSATEYRNLLTLTEQIRNDKARTHIDGDLAWLSGSVEPDDDAAAIGFAGCYLSRPFAHCF